VAIPDKRLEELRDRVRAANVESVGDPAELARLGVRAHLVATRGPVPPDRPEVDVRLHGLGVPAQEVAVRDAAAILLSVQETVASIGQALRQDPTLQGSIQAQILKATELHMTPDITGGSVVFHLFGPGESVTGDEAAELTGTDTLVDAAMSQLLSIVEQSAALGPDSSELARDLRRLGPRTAKHLSDLVRRVISDEIDIDLSWRNPTGQRRRATIARSAAMALEHAIALNRVDTQIVEIAGVLVTISTQVKAELNTESGRIHMTVDPDLAATLGPFYNQEVRAVVEQVTTWSTNTGRETKAFRLLEIRLTDTEAGSES
jgi:hypothetical protein